jgi:hypothetical protein
VYRGNTHGNAIFDRSGLAEFVSYQPPGSVTRRQRIIMADLGYLGITRTCPGAILPHKRPARGELTSEQNQQNRILSRDRILVGNSFARWKMLFGICHEVFRGEIKLLGTIVRVTLAITNWHIRRHPLRRPDEELIDELSSDGRGQARELDESSSDRD